MQIHVVWPGREEIKARVEIDERGIIQKAELLGIGGPEFVAALKSFRAQLVGPLASLKAPTGEAPHEILLREVVLRLKGEWAPPFCEEELCHCRSVATQTVDLAICTGAHSARQVSERTSASTACGTCRPHVEALIQYRLFGVKPS